MKKFYNVTTYKAVDESMYEMELKNILKRYGAINRMTDAGHYITIDGEIIHIIEMKGAENE